MEYISDHECAGARFYLFNFYGRTANKPSETSCLEFTSPHILLLVLKR